MKPMAKRKPTDKCKYCKDEKGQPVLGHWAGDPSCKFDRDGKRKQKHASVAEVEDAEAETATHEAYTASAALNSELKDLSSTMSSASSSSSRRSRRSRNDRNPKSCPHGCNVCLEAQQQMGDPTLRCVTCCGYEAMMIEHEEEHPLRAGKRQAQITAGLKRGGGPDIGEESGGAELHEPTLHCTFCAEHGRYTPAHAVCVRCGEPYCLGHGECHEEARGTELQAVRVRGGRS